MRTDFFQTFNCQDILEMQSKDQPVSLKQLLMPTDHPSYQEHIDDLQTVPRQGLKFGDRLESW